MTTPDPPPMGAAAGRKFRTPDDGEISWDDKCPWCGADQDQATLNEVAGDKTDCSRCGAVFSVAVDAQYYLTLETAGHAEKALQIEVFDDI